MPQLLVIAAIGAVVFIGWRALRREMRRVGDDMHRQEQARAKSDITPLEPDSKGVYRPRKPVESGKKAEE